MDLKIFSEVSWSFADFVAKVCLGFFGWLWFMGVGLGAGLFLTELPLGPEHRQIGFYVLYSTLIIFGVGLSFWSISSFRNILLKEGFIFRRK